MAREYYFNDQLNLFRYGKERSKKNMWKGKGALQRVKEQKS